MISILINSRTVNNVTNRILILLIRNKTKEAYLPIDESVNLDEDMPVQMESPYKKERKLCILCKLNIHPDYKNVRLLSQFQSRYTGQIYGKHITGLCTYKQNKLEQEIRKAQYAGLMGYMTKDINFVNDPMLFDPSFPFRPHKY